MQREVCAREERWVVIDAFAEDGLLIINTESTPVYPRQGVNERYIKRVFDAIIALLGLVISALVNLALLVGAFTDARDPVLFKQKRVGKSGELLTVPMYVDLALSDVDRVCSIVRGYAL